MYNHKYLKYKNKYLNNPMYGGSPGNFLSRMFKFSSSSSLSNITLLNKHVINTKKYSVDTQKDFDDLKQKIIVNTQEIIKVIQRHVELNIQKAKDIFSYPLPITSQKLTEEEFNNILINNSITGLRIEDIKTSIMTYADYLILLENLQKQHIVAYDKVGFDKLATNERKNLLKGQTGNFFDYYISLRTQSEEINLFRIVKENNDKIEELFKEYSTLENTFMNIIVRLSSKSDITDQIIQEIKQNRLNLTKVLDDLLKFLVIYQFNDKINYIPFFTREKYVYIFFNNEHGNTLVYDSQFVRKQMNQIDSKSIKIE